MLTRAGTIALRALVELARSPHSVISGPELAKRQELPEARLEQILLQLLALCSSLTLPDDNSTSTV